MRQQQWVNIWPNEDPQYDTVSVHEMTWTSVFEQNLNITNLKTTHEHKHNLEKKKNSIKKAIDNAWNVQNLPEKGQPVALLSYLNHISLSHVYLSWNSWCHLLKSMLNTNKHPVARPAIKNLTRHKYTIQIWHDLISQYIKKLS